MSNGFISPVSSSPAQVTARTPVRPPRSRIAMRSSSGRSGGGPAASNRSRRRVARGTSAPGLADLGLDLQRAHEVLEPLVFLLPAAAQLGHPLVAVDARLVVGAEPAAVHPGRAALDRDHPVGDGGQQLTVVADEQHRLRRLAQPLLEPALARHVEVVVRLVEQQHLVGPAQQQFQREPFLLAAGQGGQLAVLAPLVRHAERGHRHGVPEHLRLVAARITPGRERVRVVELRLLVVALHQRELGGLQRLPRGAQDRPRQLDQEVLHRRRVAHRPDELAHDAEAAGPRDRTALGGDVAGHDAQQGGLAGPVRTDERGLRAVAHPERRVVEQYPPVGQRVPHRRHVHVTHECAVNAIARSGAPLLPPRPRAQDGGHGDRHP